MKKLSFLLMIIVVFSAVLTACDFPPQRAGSTPPPSDNMVDSGDGSGDNPGTVSTLDAVLAQTQEADGGGEQGGGADAALDEQYLTAEAGVTQTAEAIAAAPLVTATATVAPQPTAKSEPKLPEQVTLRKGEYPYCIARRLDINAQDLIRANGLISGQVYSEGLKLKIPQDAGPFDSERQLKAHPASYVTQPGDTFFSIACAFGDLRPNEIAKANGMKAADTLTSGQTIQIP